MKKQLINISVNLKKTEAENFKGEILALGLFEGDLKDNKVAAAIDKKIGGSIDRLLKIGDYKPKALSSASVYTDGKIASKRVLLIGLGDKDKFDIEVLRKAASLAAKTAVDIKCPNVGIAVHSELDMRKFDALKVGQVLAEASYFGAYRYDEFIEPSKQDRPKKITVSIIDKSAGSSDINKGIKKGSVIGESQNVSRTFANRPANIIFPMSLAKEAKKIAAKTTGLTCKVFNYAQLKQKGMGGIVAVGQGAENKPAMIIMKYSPAKVKKNGRAPVALVGKAITFDSGGISLKPGANMDCMKYDMTGGASVIGAIKAIADLKLPIEVYAIICAAENKPGSGSFRPGDIITTFSGKTVEILNTDAEGRLVLADGIHYAKTIKCQTIVDICTLTGACAVALGPYNAGLMANDDKMVEDFKQASQQSGEPLWHLPSGNGYTENMKSKIADLKNMSSSRWGGACSAASFLGEFAGDTKWAHLDIAPMMEAPDTISKVAAGGSIGFGVRAMTEFVANLCK